MKAVSPLIAAILLIGITMTLAAILSPWINDLIERSSNQTNEKVNKEIYCREMSYDFVSEYGNYGIEWDFSGTSDYLRAKIKNYGTVSVYGISFELELSDYSIVRFHATEDSRKTFTQPLRPGDSSVIEADITQDLTQDLVKITLTEEMGCTPLSMET